MVAVPGRGRIRRLRVPGRDVTGTYEGTRAAGFGPEARWPSMIGTYVLSAGYYDA